MLVVELSGKLKNHWRVTVPNVVDTDFDVIANVVTQAKYI